jgi:hypothetical protein
MIFRSLIMSVVLLIFSQVALAQEAHYRKNGPALLPDLQVTPGAVALTDKTTVCNTQWGKDERHVTPKMKTEVYAEYGTAPGKGVCQWTTRKTPTGKIVQEGCEIDHLISRELGGADDVKNLWPQPYNPSPGAHSKDWLENTLHKEVCSGTISLADAQKEIATDWYAAYLKRKKGP